MNFISLIFGGAVVPHDGSFTYSGPSKFKESFSTHYQNKIQPLTSLIEESRLESLEAYRKRGRIACIAFVILAIVTLYLISSVFTSEPAVAFLAFFVGAGIFAWAYQPVKNYKTNIKSSVFPKVFEFFGNDFRFYEQSQWHVSSLKNFDILPSYNESYTEDFVSGSHKGVDLQLMEAKLVRVSRDSKGKRRKNTVFKGIFIQLGMNKSFKSKTIVKRDKGAIGNWFGKTFSSLENVALEDSVFEKEFQVYSNDQIEARYLLTTSFMERLLSLHKIFGGSNIQCSFYQNKVLIMVASKENRFETSSIYQPATMEHEVATLLTEMNEIFQVIETLKLDEKIGL